MKPNINKEKENRQSVDKLGTVSLSPGFLAKANIGLWAFELDEGQPPRMYDDETMLGLVGLDHQVSPEEAYHAWYDNIDEAAYEIVTDAVNKMIAGEHAEVQYPWHYPDGRTIIVRCGGVRNPNYTRGIRIEGTHQDVTEMLHFDEEARKKAKEDLSLTLISSLSESYSTIYYINARTGEYQLLTTSDEYDEKVAGKLIKGKDYFEDITKNIAMIVLEEDRHIVEAISTRENIEKNLAGKKSFSIDYRLVIDGEPLWFRAKTAKISRKDGDAYYAIGVRSVDEEKRHQEQRELQQARYNGVVKALSSEYGSIYYGDLNNDLVLPYSNSDRIVSKFGEDAFEGLSYTDACRGYVFGACLKEDRAGLLKTLSLENLRVQLKDKPYFTYIYRNDNNQYCEMKCVRVDESGPLSNVVIGFAVKDEEIREQMRVDEEKQRNFDIIEILASEYTSVYYIDLTTDGLTPYTMNDETETSFGSVFRSGITYSDAFRLYVDKLVKKEDKNMMLQAGSIGNIMKELRLKKTFITTYRDADGHYSEMKFVKVGNEQGIPTAVALGFADKDAELRARQEEEEKLQRNIDIIEILASEYTSVYYVDLATDELDTYTMNEQTETEFGRIFRSGIHYSEAFRMYVNTLVYEDDKKMMLKAGSTYNILRELSTKKTFLTTYRDADGKYSEMKFVKVGEDESPRAVALAFADKDAELRAEMEHKAVIDRDNAVISGLSDDFGCVVYVSMDDASEHHYRFDPMFEKYMPGWSHIDNFVKRMETLTNTIMHPDDRAAFRTATQRDVVREITADGEPYYVNFRILVDGEVKYYQAKFVKDEHSDNHVIVGFHNVDAETKRELEALERAENANRAKTDFLFNMSHDIRTPMNAIIGFTDMALRDLHSDDQKAKDSLNKVKHASSMLLTLINDILDMSRIESGKVELNEQPVDLATAFDSTTAILLDEAKEKNLTLKCERNIQDKMAVIDLPRVERILVNLISNAIKYTHNGGYVKVRMDQLKSDNPEIGKYRFEVADNGIGMSEEFQKHMFEEFAREENSTVSGIQGTGLGLSLAQKLAQMMGGNITCKSKQGEGSTFYLTLPFKLYKEDQKADKMADKEEELAAGLTGKKVLLVEDNELNREIANEILLMAGMTVETATNGEEAVQKVKDNGIDNYDFILMDIQMPKMNGYEATRAIREIERSTPTHHVPIIALSANAFEEDRKLSFEAGMDEHIAKPIVVSELLTTMKKFLK